MSETAPTVSVAVRAGSAPMSVRDGLRRQLDAATASARHRAKLDNPRKDS